MAHMDTKLEGGLLKQKQALAINSMLPHQWDALNDRVEGAQPSGAMHNLRLAARGVKEEPVGPVFVDSDLGKYLEAVAWAEEVSRGAKRRKSIQECIKLLSKAQQPDGYLNTHFIPANEHLRWTNLKDAHELYVAGHFLEAAVTWYLTTGKTDFLAIMERNVECIAEVFGTEEGKLPGYPGHEELELALAGAYEATGKEKYLDLLNYFLSQRGQKPHIFALQHEQLTGNPPPEGEDYHYYQAHLPVTQQRDAVGHSVRAVYLYSAMADAARLNKDTKMEAACEALWHSITDKRMYITGGIGSSSIGEAFTLDYDLPNEHAYSETCASIGLMFFARRMLMLKGNGEYADVMERALYNSVLAGVSEDGQKFFYVNPLSVWPQACEENPTLYHVKTQRQSWFGCACCPPNVARLLSSLQQYVYIRREDVLFCALYTASTIHIKTRVGQYTLSQHTSYPWHGRVVFDIAGDSVCEDCLALRIPAWCDEYELVVNGSLMEDEKPVNGYIKLRRRMCQGDKIVLELKLKPRYTVANPKVRANTGMVALQRGPIVYCAEQADNGADLHRLAIDTRFKPAARWHKDVLGGIMAIDAHAVRETGLEDGPLYQDMTERPEIQKATARFVPYFAWGNRGEGEMRVWMRTHI